MQQPTCGRIVLVMVPGTEIVRPAIIITATGDEITAHVFGMSHTLDQGGFVGRFTKDAIDANGEALATPGTWHWPPREPEPEDGWIPPPQGQMPHMPPSLIR